MSELQLKIYILQNPQSDIARAYAMGLRDKSLELSKSVEKLFKVRK